MRLTQSRKREFIDNASRQEIAYLVREYYIAQENRIRANAQMRALADEAQPTFMLEYLSAHGKKTEALITRILDAWTEEDQVTAWARQFIGVGPVIAAGFRARINFAVLYPSQVLQFCGITKAAVKKRGQKLNYCADLKRLAYLLANSFEKCGAKAAPDDPRNFYWALLQEERRKGRMANEAGKFSRQAAEKLAKAKAASKEARATWGQGKLTDSHLRMRALRKVEQVFLTHLHEVGHYHETGKLPPLPWQFEHAPESSSSPHDKREYIPVQLKPEWLPKRVL